MDLEAVAGRGPAPAGGVGVEKVALGTRSTVAPIAVPHAAGEVSTRFASRPGRLHVAEVRPRSAVLTTMFTIAT